MNEIHGLVDPLAIRDNLASLNEIVAEIVAFTSPDPEFISMTIGVLRELSWRLGYEFQGQHADAEFYRKRGLA